MKASATIYKGIEFVTLQELPADQQILLQADPGIERIKILIDEKIVGNCIQYKHYAAWYAASFESPEHSPVLKQASQFADPSLVQ